MRLQMSPRLSLAEAEAPPPTVRLAYVGEETFTVRGTFSGRAYDFSPARRVQRVDARDSRVFLRTRFFRLL